MLAFHAASALLLAQGRTFTKHAGVRSAVHQHLIKPGLISQQLGELYDRAFDDRNEVDYEIVPPPDSSAVRQQIAAAEQFVAEMKRLLSP